MRTAIFSEIDPVAKRPVRGPITASGLTAKQETFARAVVMDGMSLSDAYRASHCADTMASGTLWTKASLLAKSDKVRSRMVALQAEMDRRYYDDAQRTRALVFERLWEEALTARQDGARIRALELLGKSVGMFRDRQAVEVVGARSAEEISAELEARLKALLA